MFKKGIVLKSFVVWLPIAVSITLICGLVYAGIHQDMRLSANDPQIQIAEDMAEKLKAGGSVADSSLVQNIDISKSLATYSVVYDSKYNVLFSTGQLDGHSPIPPQGVLEYAKLYGRNSVTWQPKPDVRSAIVVVYYDGGGGNTGYVLAGRSLKEVETRSESLLFKILIGWAIILGSSLFSVLIAKYFDKSS